MKKILLLLLFTSTLQSCFISKAIETRKMKREFIENNGAIPPDFGKDYTVLMVQLRGRGSYDRYLKSAAKKYLGEYIIVKTDESIDEKYPDKKKFRYVFDYSDGSTVTTQFSNGKSASSVYKKFYVYDRLKKIRYQSGAEFTFFAKAMKIYFKNLELKRISTNLF